MSFCINPEGGSFVHNWLLISHFCSEMTMARRFSPNHVRRPFDFGPIVRADAFADEKRESDTAVLFVVDEESDNFVRDLHKNRWRLGLKFIPRAVHPGAPSFAEDTKSPQPPIEPPSGATDRPHGEFKHKPILLHIENSKKGKKGKKHTNVKKAKKGKKHMNVKKHTKGKKAKKQMNGKKGKKQRSVIH
jgi:hypothetical protein